MRHSRFRAARCVAAGLIERGSRSRFRVSASAAVRRRRSTRARWVAAARSGCTARSPPPLTCAGRSVKPTRAPPRPPSEAAYWRPHRSTSRASIGSPADPTSARIRPRSPGRFAAARHASGSAIGSISRLSAGSAPHSAPLIGASGASTQISMRCLPSPAASAAARRVISAARSGSALSAADRANAVVRIAMISASVCKAAMTAASISGDPESSMMRAPWSPAARAAASSSRLVVKNGPPSAAAAAMRPSSVGEKSAGERSVANTARTGGYCAAAQASTSSCRSPEARTPRPGCRAVRGQGRD